MSARPLDLGLALFLLAPLASSQRAPRPPSFAELRKNLPDLPWVVDAALADFDGDGDLDALIATRPPTWLSPELLLYENDGHAIFRRAATVLVETKDPEYAVYSPKVADLAVADVDGDGDADCLFTMLFGSRLLVLRNEGAPSRTGILLAQETELRTAAYLWEVVPADIDADGDVDAVLKANAGRDSILLARGLGRGRFAASGEAITGSIDYLGDVDVVDLDADGKLDILYAAQGAQLLFGDGTGAFTPGPLLPSAPFSGVSFVSAGDIDGDRDVDVVFDGLPFHTAVNQGGRAFVEVQGRIPLLERFAALELDDVDRDHDLDLVLGSALLFNDGSGYFTDAGAAYPPGPSRDDDTRSVEVADLDGDADVDFLLGGSNRVLLGNGQSFVDANPAERLSPAPQEVADLDADGDLDALLVSQEYPALVWSLLANDGRGAFERVDDVVAGVAGGGQAVFGDLDGDGDPDALLRYSDRVLANDGRGRFTVLPATCSPALDAFLLDVALGDLDGDGDLDAFHGRGSAGPPRYEGGSYEPWFAGLWRNDGSACFTDESAQLARTPDLGLGVAVGDVDADGDRDLVTSYGTVFTNLGNGVFREPVARIGLGRAYRDVALADLDRDGALDVCFSGEIAWNDGSGAFPVLTSLSYYAAHVRVGDLNHDGLPDVATGLIVPSYLRGPIITFAEVQVNQGGRTFAPGPLPLTDTFEFALGDLDGDADLDLFDGRRTFFDLERSLSVQGAPRVAHPLVLELHDRPRASYVLFAAPSLGLPVRTPFGVWRLDPAGTRVLATGAMDGTGTALVRFDIPRDPALIGLTLYWQALSGRPPRLTGFERTTLTGY